MLISTLTLLRMLVMGDSEEPVLLDKPMPPKDGDRALHSPQYQTGHHVPTRRPACFTETDTSPRGEIVEGWPDGVKPGLRRVFFDQGRSCGCATTLEQWEITKAHTPGCDACARAKRGLDIAAGLIQPDG